jgi:hypothetical protein
MDTKKKEVSRGITNIWEANSKEIRNTTLAPSRTKNNEKQKN